MNQDTSREDRTALDLIEFLDRQAKGRPYRDLSGRLHDPPPGPPPQQLRDSPPDSESETLKRLYLELLGLVPFELEPLAPRPEVKRRLMARIAGGEAVRGQDAASGLPETAAGSAGSSALQEPGPRRLDEDAPVTAGSAGSAVDAASAVPAVSTMSAGGGPGGPVQLLLPRPARQTIRWRVVLAAALILALAGLASWMYRALVQQDQTIARLALLRESEDRRVERALIQASRAREELDELRSKLALVTSPGVEISPLRPVGSSAAQPDAHGTLFVAADHQHWMLTLHGLGPAGPARCYQLWFLSDAGPVSGGVFNAQPGAPAELSSRHMPLGTKGVLVTEELGSGSRAPSGPEILRAAEPFRTR
ncbi:MAG TPA: anti-sigma factor [Thermoanaerobaculia bacterium]|nr:anti-sigma factor [Thermoanaerobaculia bacterium]